MKDESRDEAGASEWARIIGASEDVGGGVGDQAANELYLKPLGDDPWLPWTCPKCGDDDRHGMPRNCLCCGWTNYGEGVA